MPTDVLPFPMPPSAPAHGLACAPCGAHAERSDARSPTTVVTKPAPPVTEPGIGGGSGGGSFSLLQLATSVISTLDEVVERLEGTRPPEDRSLASSKPQARHDGALHRASDDLMPAARAAQRPDAQREQRLGVDAADGGAGAACRAASAPASPRRAQIALRVYTSAPGTPPEPNGANLWAELSSEISEINISQFSEIAISEASEMATSLASSLGAVDRWIDGTLDALFQRVLALGPGADADRAAHAAVDERAAPWCFREPTLGALEPKAHARMLRLSAQGGRRLLRADDLPDDAAAALTARLPPGGALSGEQLEALLPLARAAIAGDPGLPAARRALVPSRLSERAFWCAYARHCLAAKRALVLEHGDAALRLASSIADEPWSPTSPARSAGAGGGVLSAGGSSEDAAADGGWGGSALSAESAAQQVDRAAADDEIQPLASRPDAPPQPASAAEAWACELERCIAEIVWPREAI